MDTFQRGSRSTVPFNDALREVSLTWISGLPAQCIGAIRRIVRTKVTPVVPVDIVGGCRFYLRGLNPNRGGTGGEAVNTLDSL